MTKLKSKTKSTNERLLHVDFNSKSSQLDLLHTLIDRLVANKSVSKKHLYVQLGYKMKDAKTSCLSSGVNNHEKTNNHHGNK